MSLPVFHICCISKKCLWLPKLLEFSLPHLLLPDTKSARPKNIKILSYRLSKRACPILYNNSLFKMGKYLWDMQYVFCCVFIRFPIFRLRDARGDLTKSIRAQCTIPVRKKVMFYNSVLHFKRRHYIYILKKCTSSSIICNSWIIHSYHKFEEFALHRGSWTLVL